MTRVNSGSAGSERGRALPGLRRRGQGKPGSASLPRDWTCPDCGLGTKDPVAVRLGYCASCRDFTGMCGAGRKIVCPDVITQTAWHTPCTNLGTAPWRVSEGASDASRCSA